jgi:hypothetical protein
MSSPDGVPTPARAAPDWQVSYVYTRWRPTYFVAASAQTSFFAGPATDAGTPSAATLLERQLEAGIGLPIRHVRRSHQALVSVLDTADEDTRPAQPPREPGVRPGLLADVFGAPTAIR